MLWYFVFPLGVLVYFFEHVTGLWFEMDISGNVCKYSFVFMQFRNWDKFSVLRKKSKAVI